MLLQSSTSPGRDNIFNLTKNASTFSTLANAEKDVFENEFDWQLKNKINNYTIQREIKKNLFTTFLGENAKVKKEISQNGILTKIYQGFIINARVDAIVSAANERLDNCSGVAEVISNAAGSEMEIDCRTKMGQWLKVEVSGNIITCAGNLPCRWVIHAVGPRWNDYNDKEEALQSLYKTVVNILVTASERQMKSVVMPPLSSGQSILTL